MGSAIKQRTRPCCVILCRRNDFVAFFLCRVLGKLYFCRINGLLLMNKMQRLRERPLAHILRDYRGAVPPRVSPLLPRLMSGELKINEVEPQLL